MISHDIRNTVLSVLAVLSLIFFPACEGGGGKTIVKVGGSKITEGDLETLARVNPRLKPRLATPAGKDKVVENYVEQEILYQESVSRGLNRSKDLKDKIALYEKILVAQALLDDELGKKVKEYYENHKDEFERVKVAHILIKTVGAEKAEPAKEQPKDKKKPSPPAPMHSEAVALKLAQAALDRVAKGEDFAKVAKEVSEDERTKPTGGDLGYITLKDKRLERWGWLPLAEKAFSMKAGEVSEPIKGKDGYHVLKVVEEKKLQAYEEAEAGIKFRLQADIRTQLLEGLKKKYKVAYAEKETKAPAATPSTPAAPATPETAPAPSSPGPEATPPVN